MGKSTLIVELWVGVVNRKSGPNNRSFIYNPFLYKETLKKCRGGLFTPKKRGVRVPYSPPSMIHNYHLFALNKIKCVGK